MRGKDGTRQKRYWPLTAVIGCWLLMPSERAQAHTTFPGLGEFASGFRHPLTTPPHLLVLLALGLWFGQRAPVRIREPAAVFAVAAAGGLLLTVAAHIGGVYPTIFSIIALCVGACVAVGAPMSFTIKLVACGVAALLLGMDSGVEAGTPGMSGIKILCATWVSLVLCLINVAFYVSLLPSIRWVQIGVRILGSWIVAITFLLLAFALRH